MFKKKNTDKSEKKANALWQKWKSLKKRWKTLIIIILIVIVWISFSQINKGKRAAAQREIVPVLREDMKKESIRSGQIELQGVVEVTPPISGVITELNVQNGQKVKKGDILFKIKSNATQAELSQAWANYLAAKNVYEDTKISIGETEWGSFESAKRAMNDIEEQLRIYEELHPDKKNSGDREYQSLKYSEASARHNLNMAVQYPNRVDDRHSAAKASYQAATAAYNASKDGTYTSPIDGQVENAGINLGENVKAGIGDKTGTPLFLIVPDGKKTISMQIGPNDAMIMEEGQKAIVKNNYVPDSTFSAQIVRVDKVGKVSDDKGLVYRAWLEVDDTNNELLLGVPVEISIITAEKTQVLVIPTEAVHNKQVTLVDAQGKVVEERTVVTGLKVGSKTEIIEGLNEGDSILINHDLLLAH